MSATRRLLRVAGLATLAVAVACGAACAAFPVFAALLPPLDIAVGFERSVVVLDRNGKLLRPFTTKDGRWRLPVDPDEVDPRYLRLLSAYEDRRFLSHPGVDALAMLRAASQFAVKGQIVSGGSTLTMQVARLLEPRPERSIAAKLRQAARAIDLERRYSKNEILRLYLALAPFGGNLEGVRAASLAYLGKEPKRLSLGEAALLVGLPQSPETRRPDRFAEQARLARNRVLDRAQALRLYPDAEIDHARAETIPASRSPFPSHAPQMAEAAAREAPGETIHRLTLDGGLQASLEALAHDRAASLGPKVSVAIVATDNATGEILASVGGADYLSADRKGAIDLTHAIRSPGSALKPFIYGIAFEEGLAHPETQLEDRPSRYGLYAPENFDLTFQGTVSARHALQLSLNVPAVDLLSMVGPQRFLTRLRVAGARLVMPDESVPGLSVGLGGVGIRLADLAMLYTGVARGGDSIALVKRMGEPPQQARRFLDPVAAWYLADILRGSPPPPNAPAGRFAFKTGTSYGFRDAWAVGFDTRHTIAVWIGRPDGVPVPGLSGRIAAAPILNDAFTRLGIVPAAFARPPDALVTSNAGLPPPLRRAKSDSLRAGPGELAVRIAFPQDGSRIDLASAGEGVHDVTLKAQGGIAPLTWMIDGKPLAQTGSRRQTSFTPDGLGFVRILVMDARGATDSVSVRLQ